MKEKVRCKDCKHLKASPVSYPPLFCSKDQFEKQSGITDVNEYLHFFHSLKAVRFIGEERDCEYFEKRG